MKNLFEQSDEATCRPFSTAFQFNTFVRTLHATLAIGIRGFDYLLVREK